MYNHCIYNFSKSKTVINYFYVNDMVFWRDFFYLEEWTADEEGYKPDCACSLHMAWSCYSNIIERSMLSQLGIRDARNTKDLSSTTHSKSMRALVLV